MVISEHVMFDKIKKLSDVTNFQDITIFKDSFNKLLEKGNESFIKKPYILDLSFPYEEKLLDDIVCFTISLFKVEDKSHIEIASKIFSDNDIYFQRNTKDGNTYTLCNYIKFDKAFKVLNELKKSGIEYIVTKVIYFSHEFKDIINDVHSQKGKLLFDLSNKCYNKFKVSRTAFDVIESINMIDEFNHTKMVVDKKATVHLSLSYGTVDNKKENINSTRKIKSFISSIIQKNIGYPKSLKYHSYSNSEICGVMLVVDYEYLYNLEKRVKILGGKLGKGQIVFDGMFQ